MKILLSAETLHPVLGGADISAKLLLSEIAKEHEVHALYIGEKFDAPYHLHPQKIKRHKGLWYRGFRLNKIWKKIFSVLNADHIIKIFCDSPFIDMDIIAEMIDVHTKYLAEFTYSENLPSGYSCEIISRELVNAIPEPEEKTLPIGQVIRSNINKFDVELYYKEPDVRDKRLSFRCGNPREKRIMERIYDISGSFPKYGQIKEIIDNNPGVLFIGPSYLDIELTGRCNLDCIFCYRKILKKRGRIWNRRYLKKH